MIKCLKQKYKQYMVVLITYEKVKTIAQKSKAKGTMRDMKACWMKNVWEKKV